MRGKYGGGMAPVDGRGAGPQLTAPMNHEQMSMAGPSGTIEGHLLPGLLLMAWAVAWMLREFRSRPSRSDRAPMEPGTLVPAIKILSLFVAGWIEMPNSGWSPLSYAMGWHHITIYMGYALSGIVDLLHNRGRLSHRATYMAFAGASLNAAFIFYGHGNHGGVESTAHLLLAGAWAVTGLLALLEMGLPGRGMHWLRIGSMAGLGAWLAVIAWLLFLSGWDLADPNRVLWVFPIFSWTFLAVSLLMVLILAVFRPGSADEAAA